MATREQIAVNASSVDAAFGGFLKWRGTPDVPPIAQISGVSYQPAQHTLYKEFGDAIKSLPELLKGAKNTYETYWEQAKKSADDYRKGKSLAEINAELDAGEVPLQYRPLLMSALEFRQGQESMQMAAQELTTKINSGEYADLSPIDLDQAVTDFMNEQLGGLQEAHGTTGGTDAFYNGYYSEVAKVREFAQQRNDQLVEQRRQQDIQIQAVVMANELGQTALSSQDVMAGAKAAMETLNLSPADELQFLENVMKSASSNPNGVSLLNDLRSMPYRDGTLEDFFTKANFDSAVIDTYNTLRQADAERWSKDIERWDSLARGGAVGRLRGELNNALQASGNLETTEVQHIRQALLQSQHVAEAMAKAKNTEAIQREMAVGALSGETRVDLSRGFGSEWGAVEYMTNVLKPISEDIKNAPTTDEAQALTQSLVQGLKNLSYTNPSVGAKVGMALYPELEALDRMTPADIQLGGERPELYYLNEGINALQDPQAYARRKQQDENQLVMLKGILRDTTVYQTMMGDASKVGGHEALWFMAEDSNNIAELRSNMVRSKYNYMDTQYSKQHDELSETLFKGDPLRSGIASRYSKVKYTPQQLNNPTVQADIKRFVNDRLGLTGIDSLSSSMSGTPNIQVGAILKNVNSDLENQFKSAAAFNGKDAWNAMGMFGITESNNLLSFAVNNAGISLVRSLGLPDADEFTFGLTPKEFNGYLSRNNLAARVWQNDVSGEVMMAITDLSGNPISQNAKTTIKFDDMLSRAKTDKEYYWKLLQVAKGKTKEEMLRLSSMRVSEPTTVGQWKKAFGDADRFLYLATKPVLDPLRKGINALPTFESLMYGTEEAIQGGIEGLESLINTDIKIGTEPPTLR